MQFSVAVRTLAEFCFRSGDIDYRFGPSPTALEGIEGHQRLAQSRGESYQAEYALEESFALASRSGCSLLIRGRADGYDAEAGFVEEVKTCRGSFQHIPEGRQQLHWAQAHLYAALLCRAETRQRLTVRLTYWNVDTREEWVQSQDCPAAELQQVLDTALERYGEWIVEQARYREQRDRSIGELDFPHGSWRPGQRDMAEAVYKCIDQRGQLLLQAPTGIGKTAAVLFPAIKALRAAKHERVVYLTARTVGRRTAEQTLQQFREAGLELRSLSLSAKETVCLSPGKACHGDDCPYARGYYDRLQQAMQAAQQLQSLDREALDGLAREHDICPYQLATDMLPWVDVLIADLNYAYGFHALFNTLMESYGYRWSVLLDEAHNLPDRGRGMYSATLGKATLMAARREAGGRIRKALDRCNRQLLALQKLDWQEAEFDACRELPGELVPVLQGAVGEVSAHLGDDPAYLQARPALRDLFFELLQFLRVAEVFGPDYRFERHRGGGAQSLVLKLNCLDPARLLQSRQAQAGSVTAFSATVSPPSWVIPALGFGEQAVYRCLPSPFAEDQLHIVVDSSIDTRYRARQQTLPALCHAILDWLDAHPGNCIVYFPSYRYMEDALQLLQEQLGHRSLHIQGRGSDEVQRAELLQGLQQQRNAVAFCILGGVFGEGIDLPGEALSSVVVVGVGLPQFSPEREQLKSYFAESHGRGFEYAYQYPGMQKVNQAIGRVIRRDEDQGAALLLDSRYSERAYRELLPSWWVYE